MDTSALTVTLAAAITLAPRTLNIAFRQDIGRAASDSFDGLTKGVKTSPGGNAKDLASQSTLLLRQIFASIQRRLAAAWSKGLLATAILFGLFFGLAFAAVCLGVVLEESSVPLILGCLSAATLLILIVWRPYRRTFSATVMLQRLEIVLAGLEQERSKHASLTDPDEALQCACDTNRAVFGELAKLAIIRKSPDPRAT